MNELKACPFCGGPVAYSLYQVSGEHHINCPACGTALFFDVDKSQEEVAQCWNKRRGEALAALVTLELAELLERLAGNAEHLAYEYHDLLVREIAEQDEQTIRALAAEIREALDER